MPRFFGRRKSTADNNDDNLAEPSFRVLDRTEVVGKSFDGGARLSQRTHHMPTTSVDINVEDNIFADLKANRGSGSSNATKTTSTDNSSRHSNASTAPSSTVDVSGYDEPRTASKKQQAKQLPRQSTKQSAEDIPIPPIPKSSGFLKAAGRSFSFGNPKKSHEPVPVDEPEPELQHSYSDFSQTPRQAAGRARATTASTSTTVTPPKVDEDFNFDLGGDFSKMMLGYDKRASTASAKDETGRSALGPRSLTGNRVNQPGPIQIDRTTKVEAPPYSWASHHSGDKLMNGPSLPDYNNENVPPPVPRHESPFNSRVQSPSPDVTVESRMLDRKASGTDTEDEDSRLLSDSLAVVSKFMSGDKTNAGSSSRYRRNEDTFNSRQASWESRPARFDPGRTDSDRFAISRNETVRFDSGGDDYNLFGTSTSHGPRMAKRYTDRKQSPPQNKVMTPAEFERYRKDQERREREAHDDASDTVKPDEETNEEEEDNYEDDEDDVEKARQQAKQRRKQEAHMAVYRQQMMKVTGESVIAPPSRPSLPLSMSTPNLLAQSPALGPGTSDNSDDDEEVPLAILAAHGFPSKNRPPTRLTTMSSNPNLRAAAQPSYQRPGSVVGTAGAAGGPLPAFARKLPQDPFVGAGLVNKPVRESFALGGGSLTPSPSSPLPPGGLIGVIATEERNRAARRGSPHVENQIGQMPGFPAVDPMSGIPSHMMYPPQPLLTPGDQAQIQMTQQMQQFMQMQMQFMQMMAGQSGGAALPRPGSQHMAAPSTANLSAMNGMGMPMGNPEMMRHSFVGNESILNVPHEDVHVRSQSMVQPSSASWVRPLQNVGYTPSIRAQGGLYAPSIAPSERSNIGLPGRYRPVSQAINQPPSVPGHVRKSSTMSGALSAFPEKQPTISVTKSGGASDDDDDEQGWAAMKAKREKKKSMWKSKKNVGSDIGALIS